MIKRMKHLHGDFSNTHEITATFIEKNLLGQFISISFFYMKTKVFDFYDHPLITIRVTFHQGQIFTLYKYSIDMDRCMNSHVLTV